MAEVDQDTSSSTCRRLRDQQLNRNPVHRFQREPRTQVQKSPPQPRSHARRKSLRFPKRTHDQNQHQHTPGRLASKRIRPHRENQASNEHTQTPLPTMTSPSAEPTHFRDAKAHRYSTRFSRRILQLHPSSTTHARSNVEPRHRTAQIPLPAPLHREPADASILDAPAHAQELVKRLIASTPRPRLYSPRAEPLRELRKAPGRPRDVHRRRSGRPGTAHQTRMYAPPPPHLKHSHPGPPPLPDDARRGRGSPPPAAAHASRWARGSRGHVRPAPNPSGPLPSAPRTPG